MNFPDRSFGAKPEKPTESEIAALAMKFYLDNNCQAGHDRENWLCAEFMLVQKLLIQCQLSSLHDRELALAC